MVSCDDNPRNYKEVVVEKTRSDSGKKGNWAVSEGEYTKTGTIVIQDFSANLFLSHSGHTEIIRVSVGEEFKEDTAFFPQVRQGRNQVIITGHPNLPKEQPSWYIELPERFELRVDGFGYSVDGQGLVGVLLIKNQKGNILLDSCEGAFEILTQEGSIQADDIVFQGRSKFTTNLGDISIQLAADVEYDVAINSGSGNVNFSTQGFKILGSVKTIAKNGLNAIKSDWASDSSGTFISSGLEIEYEFKQFIFGGIQPEITLGSGSGKVLFSKSVTEF